MNLTVDITTSTLTVDVIVGNELTVDVTVYSQGQGGSDLTADELAAVQGANNPSASNVFATMADVGGGGAVYSVNGQTGVVVLDYSNVGAEPANANIQEHISATGNPHGLTLVDLGAQAELGYTPENINNKSQANGYASLGADGKVPASELPASTGASKGFAISMAIALG